MRKMKQDDLDALKDIAEEYHRNCDEYDRLVCKAISPRSGEPMPRDDHEYQMVGKNALHERHRACLKGKSRGYDQGQVEQAISYWSEHVRYFSPRKRTP